MPKASPMQNRFNSGEWAPELEGRSDLDLYGASCLKMENFIAQVQGGAQKRPGTYNVNQAIDEGSDTFRTRLIPFISDEDTAYVVEFSYNWIRWYKDGDIHTFNGTTISNISATNPAIVTTTGSHGLNAGEHLTIVGSNDGTLNEREFAAQAPITATTFAIPVDGSGWSAGGTVKKFVEINHGYNINPQTLTYAQSVDVMYLASSDNEPMKLVRNEDLSWTLSKIGSDFDWQPFASENVTDRLMHSSAATGAVTITLSGPGASPNFTSSKVGSYIKFREIPEANHDEWAQGVAVSIGDTRQYLGNVYRATVAGTTGVRAPVHLDGSESDGAVNWDYVHSGEGYVQITGYTSSTVVSATVIKELPESVVGAGNATKKWSWGAWGFRGWPGKVAFFEDRLIFAQSRSQPQSIWGSAVGDYENFKSGTNDDDAYEFTINSRDYSKILWIVPGNVLTIGTSSSEYVMSGGSNGGAVTPTNVQIYPQETRGSRANVIPLTSGPNTLFTTRSGRKLLEIRYVFDSDSYESFDISILANHAFDGGIRHMQVQEDPQRIIWVITSDFKLIGITYEKTENVIAFHQHVLGGNAAATGLCIIPHPDGDQDQVWLKTFRPNMGYQIEVLEKEWVTSNTITSSCYLDSAIKSTGILDTIRNLYHLEGETVAVVEDGVRTTDKTVSNGQIALDGSSVTVAYVGYPYNATIQTMKIDAGAADGTAQGKTKRITNLTTRLYQTGEGLYIGPNTTTMEELDFTSGQLFDGDKGPEVWPEGYEQEGRITLQHREPFPCMILALMPQLVTQDR